MLSVPALSPHSGTSDKAQKSLFAHDVRGLRSRSAVGLPFKGVVQTFDAPLPPQQRTRAHSHN